MTRRLELVAPAKWQHRLSALILMLTICTPVWAHHQMPRTSRIKGLEIPAIAHGEMLVIAKHRSEILDLANRLPNSDQIVRQLMSFVGLQHLICFWSLVPGSLTEDESPFNECSHAALAGTRALLTHMTEMDSEQPAATALLAQIDAEILNDPVASAVCANSGENFETGTLVRPDWSLVWNHPPTLLSLFGFAASVAAGLAIAGLLSWNSKCARGSRMITSLTGDDAAGKLKGCDR